MTRLALFSMLSLLAACGSESAAEAPRTPGCTADNALDQTAAVSPVLASADNRRINSEMKTRAEDTNQGVSVQVDYSFRDLQFTSITAHRGWKNTQFQDQDRLSTVYKNFNQIADRGELDFSQFTQEFRVASTKKQFFEYVGGLFFYDGKTDEVYRRDLTRCASSTATALASGLVPCSPGSITADNGVATYGTHSKSTATTATTPSFAQTGRSRMR